MVGTRRESHAPDDSKGPGTGVHGTVEGALVDSRVASSREGQRSSTERSAAGWISRAKGGAWAMMTAG